MSHPPADHLSAARLSAARAFYDELADSPLDARRVGWESDRAHRARHLAIAQALAPLSRVPALVDAGCGEGALLTVLRGLGWRGRYRGEDILPEMLERARARHDDPGAEWVAVDALAGGPPAEAVICSGALNTVVDPGRPHTAQVIEAVDALWARATTLLVFDLAVGDRHAEGVGIGRTDLAEIWRHARRLCPAVTVREDVLPGEALLILARSRGHSLHALPGQGPDAALMIGEVLLAGGDAESALVEVEGDARPEARLIAAVALLRCRRLGPAEAALRALVGTEVDEAARLQLASVLWLTGRRSASDKLLRALAETSDDARYHLVELLTGRGDHKAAAAYAAAIEDRWMRREARRLAAGARRAKRPPT